MKKILFACLIISRGTNIKSVNCYSVMTLNARECVWFRLLKTTNVVKAYCNAMFASIPSCLLVNISLPSC